MILICLYDIFYEQTNTIKKIHTITTGTQVYSLALAVWLTS